jgi:hypothetical protein
MMGHRMVMGHFIVEIMSWKIWHRIVDLWLPEVHDTSHVWHTALILLGFLSAGSSRDRQFLLCIVSLHITSSLRGSIFSNQNPRFSFPAC